MRLWSWQLIPYLPDMQLKGQWRECVLIAKDLQEKGKTNHLLINILEEYPHNDFMTYCWYVFQEMQNRGFKVTLTSLKKIFNIRYHIDSDMFSGWHDKEYLRVCMANLYEKYKFGRGKSRITETEWQRPLDGYRVITGKNYKI